MAAVDLDLYRDIVHGTLGTPDSVDPNSVTYAALSAAGADGRARVWRLPNTTPTNDATRGAAVSVTFIDNDGAVQDSAAIANVRLWWRYGSTNYWFAVSPGVIALTARNDVSLGGFPIEADLFLQVTSVSGTATSTKVRIAIKPVSIIATEVTISGSVSATAPEVSAATVAAVNRSATVVTLLAANSARQSCEIENDSSGVLYLKCGSGAATSDYTRKLQPGQAWWPPQNVRYTGIITGIWVGGAAADRARVTEF